MRLSESRDELVQSLPSVSILGEANVQWLSLALIVLMAAVMMRSMVGERFTSDMVNGNTMVLVAGLIAMSGKMAGGWMAKSMGIVKALALMIGATFVCWFCRDMGVTFLLAGLFALNLTMPVTLYLANVVLKDREGLAFGLLAAALIPGYLIIQL